MAILKFYGRVSLVLIFLSCWYHVIVGKKQENSTFYRFAPERFGPFYVTSKSLSLCNSSGPEDKEHYMLSNVYVLKVSRLDEEYRGYGLVPLDVKVQKFSMEVSILRGGTVIPIYSMVSRKPCDDIMFTTLMSFYVRPDKKCVVKQGNYTVQGLNVNTLSHLVAGENFIHESFLVHFEVYSARGTIFCSDNIYESKPLKKPKKPKNT